MKKRSSRRIVILLIGLSIAYFALLAFGTYFIADMALRRSGLSFGDLIDQMQKVMVPPDMVGKVAPDFELVVLNGETFKLSEHVGREIVILNFFATWCGPCQLETPELVRFDRANRDRGVVLIGIDCDESRAEVEAFARKYSVSYPVGIDPSEIASLYEVNAFPTTVLIGADARIQRYRRALISDAESEFDKVLETNLALIRSGRAITEQEYLNLLAAEETAASPAGRANAQPGGPGSQ